MRRRKYALQLQDGGSKAEAATLTGVLRWRTAGDSPPSSRTRHVDDCRGQTVSHLFILPYFWTISLTFSHVLAEVSSILGSLTLAALQELSALLPVRYNNI